MVGCRPATRTGRFSSTTSRRPSARASATSCSRRSCSCSARTPTSPCSGSRGDGCGRRAKRSGTIFRCTNMRRPHHASAVPTVPRELSGGAATGVPEGHTRIRAIDSKKRIGPSARGRRKIRQRSVTATNLASHHRTPPRRAVARQIRRAEAGGATSPRVAIRAKLDRGATSQLPRRRAIGRGRPNRRDRGPSANPGATSLPTATSGRGPGSPRINRVWRARASVNRGTRHQQPVLVVRVAPRRAAIARGTTSEALLRRTPANLAAARRVRRRAEAGGAASRGIRIASRSRHAVLNRVARLSAARRANGATTIRIRADVRDGEPSRPDETAPRSLDR